MSKRFFLAWLVVFVAWFIGSFIVHGVLLHADYAQLSNLFRKETEAQNFFPLMILAHIIMSGAFVWIYARGVEPKPWLGQGMSYGPYAKGLAFQDGYPSAWQRMVAEHPEVAYGSTNKYQAWEVVDPEKWVPEGYACVRVDSRGAGRSPGHIDHFSPRETQDFYQCIEWAGKQRWSSGKVGLNGISYYGINQWHVASLQPPHLAAMCIWEGAADWYRDMTHHGGILSTFWANWYDMQVKTVQYGLGERGPRSRVTGEPVCGDETLSDRELQENRCGFGDDILAHPLDDDYHRGRSPVWEKITVPLLSAANWGSQELHLRGNVEGFVRAASKHKWLELHGLEHWTH